MRWLTAWEQALPDGTPCGREDIVFTPEFEALQTEVDRSSSLQVDACTDWGLVLEMATAILSATAKDLRVFCYGCRAVFENEGLAGLSSALGVMNRYLEAHWDDLYPAPNRVARRAAPFLWLVGKLEPLLPANNFPVEKAETYARLHEALSSLHETLQTRLQDAAPSFGSIIRAIPARETEVSAPQTPPATAQVSQPALVTPHVIASLEGNGRVPDSILPQLVRATAEQAQQLAVHYLSQNVRDWRIYLLHRAALWATVVQLPPSNSEKVTQLRLVVPKDKALAYAAAVENRQFAEVLPQLERSMGKTPFWFDGHYLVVQCLEGLGATEARNLICEVLRCFLQRYPELVDYKFHDGTPFASSATVQWLDSLRHGAVSGEDTPMENRADEERLSQEEALLEQAVALAEERGFEAGLASLGPSPAGRCRRVILHGMLLARYCLRMGRPKVSKELLQELYSRLEQWDMLDWEPELGAELVARLIRIGGDKGQSALRRRLFSLHAETAIRLSE